MRALKILDPATGQKTDEIFKQVYNQALTEGVSIRMLKMLNKLKKSLRTSSATVAGRKPVRKKL